MRRTYAAAIAILSGLACADARAADYRVLHQFTGGNDGEYPFASLLDVGGTLYGTTFGDLMIYCMYCGTVFTVDPATGAERTLYSFKGGSDGARPMAGLTQVGGTLYGTTYSGGTLHDGGNGTVFALNPRTGSERVVLAFPGGGDLYHPVAGLISIGGTLFGTTEYGGTNTPSCYSCGKVFRLNPATGIEKTLHTFQGGADGRFPMAALVNVGGTLYGTTQNGGGAASPFCGQYGCGTVFSVDPGTGAEHVVYAFQGAADGSEPNAGLIDVGGLLFGTTKLGGLYRSGCPGGNGTVFAVDPTSGVERIVYAFQGGAADGCNSMAGLLDVGGTLYGTTYAGGGGFYGFGTVFSLNPATGTEQVLHAFQGGSDGAHPRAGLIDVSGTLYGTTEQGSYGTVFALTP